MEQEATVKARAQERKFHMDEIKTCSDDAIENANSDILVDTDNGDAESPSFGLGQSPQCARL